jgi:hypothetical protein
MDLHDVSVIRHKNHHISGNEFNTVADIARWMGAIQAQSFSMSKWAFGIRLPDSKVTVIDEAINTGQIVRSHLLRPTWHYVFADDIHWILELTAPQIRAAARSRDKQLGLDDAVCKKSNSVIEKSLRNDKHLTRPEIVSKLIKAKLPVDENRVSHLLMRAETEGIICSGKLSDSRQTYTLLDDWIPRKKTFTHEEALFELAKRYFTSHGPATLQDFSWWSGLPARDSRQAVESVKSDFCSEVINGTTYLLADPSSIPNPATGEIYLFPAYDEFLISYRDRTASINSENHKKAVSENGIFYPVIVKNGMVIGTWKHTVKKDLVFYEADIFGNTDLESDPDSSKAFSAFADFIGKKVDGVHFNKKKLK